MAKPDEIDLPDGTRIPILYENRAVLAIDKPAGWLLAPSSWDKTSRNLHLALMSGIQGGEYWARSRHLKFLRHVHRLDADTSGVLLLAKHARALPAYSRLFETRRVEKIYLAIVRGVPKRQSWVCQLKLAPRPGTAGRMRVDSRRGQEAVTQFRVLQTHQDTSLIEARPLTGRTHQIRVHLAEAGHAVLGDALYGAPSDHLPPTTRNRQPASMSLRAVTLIYPDPFQKRTTRIDAPREKFCEQFGFEAQTPIRATKTAPTR